MSIYARALEYQNSLGHLNCVWLVFRKCHLKLSKGNMFDFMSCDLFAQVSWSLPHKQASSGTYQVKFFDEESYSALRKVNV